MYQITYLNQFDGFFRFSKRKQGFADFSVYNGKIACLGRPTNQLNLRLTPFISKIEIKWHELGFFNQIIFIQGKKIVAQS